MSDTSDRPLGVSAPVCACRDRLDASRGDAIQLRLLAGLFRIVLRGEAPELVAVLRHGLRRVRLLEPGASAGLNLNLDRYLFTGPSWQWGATASPLVIETEAVLRPEEFAIVERRGCDLSPVDVRNTGATAYLTSFVWPFNLDRHQRLAAALEVARSHPVVVDRADAAEWMQKRLSAPVSEGVLTIVWQSITRQYWPSDVSAAVDDAIEEARDQMPLSHITMEGVPPEQGTDGYDIAEHGPATSVDGEVIVGSHHHGPPLVVP